MKNGVEILYGYREIEITVVLVRVERFEREREKKSMCYQWPSKIENATPGGSRKPPGPTNLKFLYYHCVVELLFLENAFDKMMKHFCFI